MPYDFDTGLKKWSHRLTRLVNRFLQETSYPGRKPGWRPQTFEDSKAYLTAVTKERGSGPKKTAPKKTATRENAEKPGK
jgi:hypothetical protein